MQMCNIVGIYVQSPFQWEGWEEEYQDASPTHWDVIAQRDPSKQEEDEDNCWDFRSHFLPVHCWTAVVVVGLVRGSHLGREKDYADSATQSDPPPYMKRPKHLKDCELRHRARLREETNGQWHCLTSQPSLSLSYREKRDSSIRCTGREGRSSSSRSH